MDNKVYQNVICSAKGGTGKTTFAIRLALYLQSICMDPSRVCVLDLDMQGSSMKELLFGMKNDLFKNKGGGAFIAPFSLADKMYSLSLAPGEDEKRYVSRFSYKRIWYSSTPCCFSSIPDSLSSRNH